MEIRVDEISRIISEQIRDYGGTTTSEEKGTIVSVGDGIANVYGLAGVMSGELVQFPHDVCGIALNLEEDIVGIAIMGDDSLLREGDEVCRTGRIASVPVGEAIVGRVVNAMGVPLDGEGEISLEKLRSIEARAPGIVSRQPVSQPLYTGIKAIDSMTPVGCGQRELIIGDRQTGKTAIAVDTIINQRGRNVFCIYVAIGQKISTVARVVDRLKSHGAMGHTTVVVAGAADPAPLQYLAPYSGVTMAEFFRDTGRHALVVYDDLSKHAVSYRQLSLLLRRPPGREAYPGDVFYLHSRLLERAAKLNEENGGGSLTALPIIETQAGDVSAYIPTNVISITDGQIYLETDLFNAGIRPALNIGISVSRVGSKAQTKAMKNVAGKLKLAMAQYRELAAFAQFGTAELDKATRSQIERGQRITEVLKQPLYIPMSIENQIIILYSAINGYIDDVPVKKVVDFEAAFIRTMDTMHSEIGKDIKKTKDLSDKTEEKLKAAIEQFKKGFATE